MEPLRIVAKLAGPLTLTDGMLRLDALLIWAEATRRGLPPLGFGPAQEIEIPVAMEPGGRFHLCSFACPRFDQHEPRYINRRFPIPEAQMLAEPKFKSIHINAGAQKSYRIPGEVSWCERDEIEWWCIGDADGIRELLTMVGYLGKRRGVGRGKVREWTVEPCEPWGDGFPIVRDGKPMRALPLDWPELVEPSVAQSTLSYPYWRHWAEEECAVPEVAA
jgi:hypothetical protein